MNVIDLQMHSTFSDGALAPDELLELCRRSGLKIVSVTDHDTVDHVTEAIAAGKRHGVRVIPGTELSVVYNNREIHMLAYRFDPDNAPLRRRLTHFRESRERRAEAAAGKLRECGFTIDLADIKTLAQGSIGRPHIAQAVLARSENATKLNQLGITTVGQLIEAFLDTDKPAYVKREKFPIEEAIALIHGAGGVTVLAHPGWTFRKNFEVIPRVLTELKAVGLDGVETFYGTHDEVHTKTLHTEAHKLNLIETAGSDFHNPSDPLFGRIGFWKHYGLTTDFAAILG